MTSDELTQTQASAPCRTCAHANTYITMGVTRVLCSLGKPEVPACRWHLDRLQGVQR